MARGVLYGARGEQLTYPARMSMGFIPQPLPHDETTTLTGISPPEVHPQDFYDAAKYGGSVNA